MKDGAQGRLLEPNPEGRGRETCFAAPSLRGAHDPRPHPPIFHGEMYADAVEETGPSQDLRQRSARCC